MKTQTLSVPALTFGAVLLFGAGLVGAEPLGTAFTYQGQLADAGTPATGRYDLQFTLYDAASGGAQVGPLLSTNALAVSAGLFTVSLDFGTNIFTGDARWLEISVRTNGGGAFTVLAPRQVVNPAPYALYALTPAGPQGPKGDTGATGATGAQGPAGLRGLTWRGIWSASGSYAADDAVQSDGSAWLAKRANKNVVPTEGADWGMLAQKGDIGPQGPQGATGPAGPGTTTDNTFYIGSDQDGNEANSTLSLGTDKQAILTVKEGGRVGINTNAPRQALHVNGAYALVEGTSGEQVYFGSDGAGHDAQMGSFDNTVTNIGFYNQSRLEYMNIFARDVKASGTVTAAAFSGGGASLASLNASSLTSGTVPDGRLSANVPLRSGGNTFTGDQILSTGNLGLGTATPESKLDVRGAAIFQVGSVGNSDNLVIKKTGALSSANAQFVFSHRSGGTTLWLYGYDGPRGYRNLQSWDYANNTVRFPADGQTLFLNQAQDRVGVGTASPQQQLHVVGNARVEGAGTGTANPALYVSNGNSAGIGVFSTVTSSDANLVAVNKGAGDLLKGFSGATGGNLVFRVSNAGYTYCADELSCKSLDIRGGADLAEPFAMSDESIRPGAVVVIDADRPGQLKLSTRAYDSTVAGIVSGAGGVAPGIRMIQENALAGSQNVALSGRVYAWVDASAAPVKPGDLLTTSDRPGHAMKATDRARAQGAILGKAMTRLNEGQGLVLVLVTLQ